MIQPPEILRVTTSRTACDGSGDIPAALGHPRVFIEIDEKGYAACGYCDRRFVLIGGPADGESHGSAHNEAGKADASAYIG
ncbi:MAG: zinc-finger domain-containing protein [Sphingobium sp.]